MKCMLSNLLETYVRVEWAREVVSIEEQRQRNGVVLGNLQVARRCASVR